jgi:hypothetical protein
MARDKMVASWRDPEIRESRLSSIRIANKSPIRRAKISNAYRKKWGDDGYREKVSIASHMRGPRSDNSTGFKGVCFDKQTSMWRAIIQIAGKSTCLGRHKTPELAAVAYDNAARSSWGDECYLNFPNGCS